MVVDGECTAVLWSAFLFYMCCLFDVCCHVALVDICFRVVYFADCISLQSEKSDIETCIKDTVCYCYLY